MVVKYSKRLVFKGELTTVELCIGEQSDIVGAVCGLYHVAFESKSVV